MRDAQGNLYSTTTYGGASVVGTAFMLESTGKETVLYGFTGTGGDGENPRGGLVEDAQGNLYGTTIGGGASGCGTVFKLTRVAAAKTTTTLTSSPNPSTYGQAVTFTATVTSSAGAPPDRETVTFMKGTTVLGTGTLSGGSASFSTWTSPLKLKMGMNSIKAVYGGDPNFAGSTSKVLKQVVDKATTTITLVSSLNPSNYKQAVTFTATVSPQFSGTVTGNVTFYDGATGLMTVFLRGGAAKFTTSTLASGTHIITARYNGSTNFIGSLASLTQTVN